MTVFTSRQATDRILKYYGWRHNEADDSWHMNGIGWYGMAGPWEDVPRVELPKKRRGRFPGASTVPQRRVLTLGFQGLLPGTTEEETRYEWDPQSSLDQPIHADFVQESLEMPSFYMQCHGRFIGATGGVIAAPSEEALRLRQLLDMAEKSLPYQSRDKVFGSTMGKYEEYVGVYLGNPGGEHSRHPWPQLVYMDFREARRSMRPTPTWTIGYPGYDKFMFALRTLLTGNGDHDFRTPEMFERAYAADLETRQGAPWRRGKQR